MSDQSILVTMLSDIQSRLGRMETTQAEIKQDVSDVSARVSVVETHCRDACGPKSPSALPTWLASTPTTTWIKLAAAVLFAAYFLGRDSSRTSQVNAIGKALVRAKIVDSATIAP